MWLSMFYFHSEFIVLLNDTGVKTLWYCIDVSVHDRHMLLFYERFHFQELLPFVQVGQNRHKSFFHWGDWACWLCKFAHEKHKGLVDFITDQALQILVQTYSCSLEHLIFFPFGDTLYLWKLTLICIMYA